MAFYDRRKRRTFSESVVGLIAHLCGTAIIFVTFFTIGWAVSYLLHWLHSIHPFPDEIFRIITKIEVVVIYADGLLCGVVLMAGALRFCKELMEDRRWDENRDL